MLEETYGIGNMRKGEVENCLVMSSQDRCVFPLRPGGVHHAQEGADAGRQAFERYLALQPDNLEVKWLLNVSYMLLGRYPQDVPPQHLLGPELFKSEAPMPRFYDVAMPTKLGAPEDIAGGTIVDDFDGDGLMDVVFSTVDYCGPLRYFHNRGDGTFEDVSQHAGILGQLGGLNAIQTDYNNDGRPDIFVMRGGWEVPMRNSLLRNNGDGTFTDVTKEAGLLDATHATHSVAWADFDNDGWVDVYIGHENLTEPDVQEPGRRHVRRRDGQGRRGPRLLHERRRGGRLRQRRLARHLRVERVRRQPAVPQQREWHLHRGRRQARRAEAARQLPDVVLRLQQRRLPRHLRASRPRRRSRSS